MNSPAPGASILRELVQRAATPVREARLLLREPAPRNLDRCGAALASAAQRLEEVRAAVPVPGPCDPELLHALETLRREVAATAVLLGNAAQFHSDLLHAMQGAG